MINLITLWCIFGSLFVSIESKSTLLRHGKRELSDVSLTEVPIVGGITTNSAVIGFRTSGAAEVHIAYADNKKNEGKKKSPKYYTLEDDDFTGNIVIDGLVADTTYWYTLYVNKNKQRFDTVLRFKTFPNAGTPLRFSIFSDAAPYYQKRAALSYESGSSNNNKDGALFAVQIGDFDHSDPPDIAAMRLMHRGLRDINDEAAGEDLASNILTKMGFVHVWDDHDYCGNDSDKTCAMKMDSLKAYNEYYPGYTRPYPTDGIYHKFSAGDAEIYMLDLRFNRDPNDDEDNAEKSMLGATQKQWLKDSLVSSTARWKVIVSTVSANKHARPDNPDHWISFTTEALELKEFLEDNDLSDSTVIVSGDLHTGGGLDGGCNNRFNVPELGIAHTNLQGGNLGAIGFWTEGIRDGDHKGYGSIYVNSTNLVLENRAPNGFVVNSLTLPGEYNTDACVNVGGEPEGLQHCSTNFASFSVPPGGDCADVEQWNSYIAPFDNADGGPPISNEVKWYDCPASDLIIMRSNDIPEHFVEIANPNKPCVQNIHAEFPRRPAEVEVKTETDNVQGFSLNGVVAFSPLEAGDNNAVEPGEEGTLLDAQHWYGHPTAQHIWHYHSPFLGKDDQSAVTITENDFLGVAMDGFPIFGPVSDPDNELDMCNFNPETMRYHIRLSDQVEDSLPYCASDALDESSIEHNWKYIVGCFSGDLTKSALKDSLATNIPSDCQEITTTQLQTHYDSYYTGSWW